MARPRSLYDQVRSRSRLHRAWRHIRRNGLQSPSVETQKVVKRFDEDAPRHVERFRRQLRCRTFRFVPARAVLVPRQNKGPRPLVLAPLQNRIVQRAILDVLKEQKGMAEVLASPMSFGAIKGRGRREALAVAWSAIKDGRARYFVRSDIKDFFTKIPRDRVQTAVAKRTGADQDFMRLFRAATETELANVDEIGDEAELFPLGADGVPQGSPLSAFMGNVLLLGFDREMNRDNVICLRYVDDFLVLGPNGKAVHDAFRNAQSLLKKLGLDVYEPGADDGKGEEGEVRRGFDFLGCHVMPGFVRPSRTARHAILARVDRVLGEGRRAISESLKSAHPPRQRYVQTLMLLDNILRGWGNAYYFCNDEQVTADLDRKIDERLGSFSGYWHKRTVKRGPAARRRALGVHLLADTPNVPIDGESSKQGAP